MWIRNIFSHWNDVGHLILCTNFNILNVQDLWYICVRFNPNKQAIKIVCALFIRHLRFENNETYKTNESNKIHRHLAREMQHIWANIWFLFCRCVRWCTAPKRVWNIQLEIYFNAITKCITAVGRTIILIPIDKQDGVSMCAKYALTTDSSVWSACGYKWFTRYMRNRAARVLFKYNSEQRLEKIAGVSCTAMLQRTTKSTFNSQHSEVEFSDSCTLFGSKMVWVFSIVFFCFSTKNSNF